MHSVAGHTAKDLKLPFRVTNAHALMNLADSLEVFMETFKDHDNHQEIGYKLWVKILFMIFWVFWICFGY